MNFKDRVTETCFQKMVVYILCLEHLVLIKIFLEKNL